MRLALLILPLAPLLLGCGSPLNTYRLILTPVATAYTTTAQSLGADNARDLDVCNGPATPPEKSVACVERVTDAWADRNKALKSAFLALKAAEDALDVATAIELAGGAIDIGAIAALTSDAVRSWFALKALLDLQGAPAAPAAPTMPAPAPAPAAPPVPAPAPTSSIPGGH